MQKFYRCAVGIKICKNLIIRQADGKQMLNLQDTGYVVVVKIAVTVFFINQSRGDKPSVFQPEQRCS